MKNLILLITAIFILSACSHNIPIANIEFTKIENNPKNKNSYLLYFSSDVELIDNLLDEHTGVLLRCLFKDRIINEDDFTKYDKYLLRSSRDMMLITEPSLSDSLYYYSIVIRFVKSDNNGSTDFLNKKDIPEITKLLNQKPNCLSCAVSAVAYMNITKRYVSHTMCLPKSEINKVMKK